MGKKGQGMSDKEQRTARKGEVALVQALARGCDVRAAAKEAGIAEVTAHRRLKEASFRQLVMQQRQGLLDKAAGMLAETTGEAAATLRGLLEAEGEMVRLGAARAVLDQATRLAELLDLAERVARLEAQG